MKTRVSSKAVDHQRKQEPHHIDEVRVLQIVEANKSRQITDTEHVLYVVIMHAILK